MRVWAVSILLALLGFPLPSWAAEIMPQLGHSGAVDGVAFSPDGKSILTSSADKTVRLWDVSTGKELRRLEGHGPSAAFSPNGKSILTGGDKTARLWDTATGKELRRFEGHGSWINSVTFSPDGKSILTGGDDRTARLWDTATGKELRRFEGHGSWIRSVTFSPDGKYILTGSDQTARLWDTATGKELRRFEGHGGTIYSVAFSPDGTSILTRIQDQTARLWDVSTGKEVRRFEEHGVRIFSAALSLDGKSILTGGDDRTARLWDTATGKELRRFEGHGSWIRSVTFSPDGKYILTGSSDQTARLWDVATGKELRRFEGHGRSINSVAFSPDGKYILTGGGDTIGGDDRTAQLWEVTTGKELRRFKGHGESINSLAFSPDGKYILTGSSDQTARLWDVATGKELRRFEGHERTIDSVAFSPDGKFILTGGNDETARLWDVATGKELRRFEGHGSSIDSVAFSPDGKFVLAGSHDHTARLWEMATGNMRLFEAPKSSSLFFRLWSSTNYGVAFSPDGKSILTSSEDHEVLQWEVATGKELRRLGRHEGEISSVTFSPDGKYILTGGSDKTARLWEVATGKELRRFKGLPINSAVFSPDGNSILTSDDITARLLDVKTGRELVRLISFADGAWLAITPDGQFNGSDDAAKYLTVVDGMSGHAMVDQEYRVLRRPDLVAAALRREVSPVSPAAYIMQEPPDVAVAAKPPQIAPPVSSPAPSLPLSIETTGRVETTGEAVVLKGRIVNARAGVSLSGEGISYPVKSDGGFEAPVSLSDKPEKIIELLASDAGGAHATATVTIVRKATEPPSRLVPIASVGRRIALILANGDYKVEKTLPFVRDDATAMAEVLASQGFEVLRQGIDLPDKLSMKSRAVELKKIAQQAGKDATILVYFSGHGARVNQTDYLIPTNPPVGSMAPETLDDIFLSVNELLQTVEDPDENRTTLLIIDACRNNSIFSDRETGFGRSPYMSGRKTVVFSATSPGTLAGSGEKLSLFTDAIIQFLRKDRITLTDLEREVGEAVLRRSNGAQEPSLIGLPSAKYSIIFERPIHR